MPLLLRPFARTARTCSRIKGSASANGASGPVCGLTWPILITLDPAALALAGCKTKGPAMAVAPIALSTSRRCHSLLGEFESGGHIEFGLVLDKEPSGGAVGS